MVKKKKCQGDQMVGNKRNDNRIMFFTLKVKLNEQDNICQLDHSSKFCHRKMSAPFSLKQKVSSRRDVTQNVEIMENKHF
jgi:hypothetical protein